MMTAFTRSRGSDFRRLLSAYVALVLLVAVAGPGVAVSAEEGRVDSLESSPVVQVTGTEGAEGPPVDSGLPPSGEDPGAPGGEIEGESPESPATDGRSSGAKRPPTTTVEAEKVTKDADQQVQQPLSLSTLSAVGDVGIAAVVPGEPSNLSFTFEGVNKDSGWTTGNLGKLWSEGEWVPYRVVIKNSDSVNSVSVPATAIQVDHYSGVAIMFDRTRSWGTYTTSAAPVDGDTWYPVTTAVAPTSQDVPINPAILGTGEDITTSFAEGYLVIPPGEYGVLYFQAHLAVTAYWNMQSPARDGAGYVPGSSGHITLDMLGIGAKTVPVPAVAKPARALTGVKFNDLDRDGVRDAGEPTLAGWTITLEGGEPGFEIGTVTAVTDASGAFSFGPLPPAIYSLSEVQQTDWTNSTPLPITVSLESADQVRNIGNYHNDVVKTFELTYEGIPAGVQPYVRYAINGGPTATAALTGSPLRAQVNVPYGASLTTIEWRATYGAEDLLLGTSPTPEVLTADKLNTFTYTASLSGSKFNDLDADGVWDQGENGLAGWTIKLWRSGVAYAEAVTGAGGAYTFSGLLPGGYTLTEVQQGGWVATVAPQGTKTVANGTAMTGLDFGNVEVLPEITVVKTALPTQVPETGGSVTFSFTITNDTSAFPVTVTSIVDDKFGDLLSTAEGQNGGLDIVLAPDASFTFTITRTLSSDLLIPHINTVTVTAVDEFGRSDTDDDDATVTFSDVPPAISVIKTAAPTSVPETGGDVVFTITVENTGTEAVDLTGAVDSVFGSIPVAEFDRTHLAVGQTATYSFTEFMVGEPDDPHNNVVTVTAEDNEGTEVSDEDDADVVYTDILPSLEVVKDVTPSYMDEPGGTFSYQVRVKNTSVEPVMLTLVEDDVYGVIYEWTDGDPEIWLLPNAVRVFDFTMDHTEAGQYDNTAEATAIDNEENPASDDDDATALVGDMVPVVEIDKTVDVSSLPEPGGDFTFTLTITNAGVEPFTITSLTDTNLTEPYPAAVAALIGQTIDPGGELSASYTLTHTEAGVYDNVAVVEVMDNEQSTDTDEDDESVTVTDVAPDVEIDKTVDVSSLPEPGGDFTFTLTITNVGIEPFTITSLTDTNLTEPYPAAVAALIGQTIDPGGELSASYTLTHTEAGVYDNVAVVEVMDNEESTDTDTDDESVEVTDVLPDVELLKSVDTTSLPEPGGDFTFTLTITNVGIEPFTITSLTDTNLTEPYPAAVAALIGQTIDPGGELSASYTLTHTEAGVYDNVAVVEVMDNEESTDTDTDDESVTVTDILPTLEVVKDVTPSYMDEPGGTFSYQVRVKNTSIEPVMLTLVEDDVYGVIYEWTDGDPEIWLLPNAVRVFDFTMDHTEAGQYLNTAEATVVDNDDNSASDSDDAVATVTDVLPIVEILKSVDTTSLPEPGGDFTFTLTITNVGIEPFTITSLTDTNLTEPYPAAVAALIGQTIDPGGELSASYTLTHTEAGVYDNVAVVEVMDNEESTDTDTDDESVEVTDVLPDVELLKSVDTTSLPEPGGDFTFTLTITNVGIEPFTITSLTDTNLTEPYPAAVAALIGQTIDPGGELSASYTLTHTEAGVYDNVAVVEVMDNEESTDTDTDDESVEVEPFLPFTEPDLVITKAVDKATAKPGDLLTYTLTYWSIGDAAAYDFTVSDDFDERYVTVVDAGGGVVANGKITWSFTGPLAAEDGKKTITFTVRVIEKMPVGTTNVDNVVVIVDPLDKDDSNNTDKVRTIVRVVEDEPFLPFTGGEYLLLISLAAIAATAGALLRFRGRTAA